MTDKRENKHILRGYESSDQSLIMIDQGKTINQAQSQSRNQSALAKLI